MGGILCIVFVIAKFLYLNFHRLNEFGYFQLMKPHFFAFTYSFLVILHVNSGILMLTIFTGCWCAIKVNLWLLKHIVVDLKRIDLKAKLLWYRRVYIKTLLYILANNKFIKNLFFLLLIVNFPVNCYLLVRVKNSADFIVASSIIFIFIEQVIAIFGVHWFIATLNSDFNKNIKFFIREFVPNSCLITRFNSANFASNLKISLFIQNYQTKKKYGFTYGSLGLISLMAFSKVRFF